MIFFPLSSTYISTSYVAGQLRYVFHLCLRKYLALHFGVFCFVGVSKGRLLVHYVHVNPSNVLSCNCIECQIVIDSAVTSGPDP